MGRRGLWGVAAGITASCALALALGGPSRSPPATTATAAGSPSRKPASADVSGVAPYRRVAENVALQRSRHGDVPIRSVAA